MANEVMAAVGSFTVGAFCMGSVDSGAGHLLGGEREILRIRRELTAYLHRFVVHPHCAEDLAQETFARALAAGAKGSAPDDTAGYRRWLFRIATNLAIDWLRGEGRRRRFEIQDIRVEAEADPNLVERSVALVGSPETALVAQEHVAACFACTVSHLPVRHAAILLLVEVHSFSVQEAADAVGVAFATAKNALQDARRSMREKYAATCALIAKNGVCHQCSELADFFESAPVDLGGDKWEARMQTLRAFKDREPGVWHTLLLGRLPRT